MDPAAVLIASSMVIMLLTLLCVSYKTGFVSFSIPSMIRDDQPKFEIDKNKIGKFIEFTVGAFVLNVVYGFVVFRDIREVGGILVLSLFNTIVIGYGLAFWVLLKEKKQKSKD